VDYYQQGEIHWLIQAKTSGYFMVHA